jgi:EAL and modified HD-GYP domain-containing signal transduction protein
MDYVGDDLPHPLLKLMDYVKVDLNRLNKAGRQRLREQLKGTRVAIMAEKVDTQEDYRNACAEGCTFFQGLYFCYPELIKNAKIPSNRVFHFEILRLLQDDFLDLKKLCPVIKRDASLVLRLLRLVNSPICAIRHEVTSIELAIIVLGELTFRRIANLAILREINGDQPAEILHMALVRARFCELAAGLGKVRPTGKDGAATARALDPSEQYLLGMFSLLPAMLRCPMETLAKDLPLRPEIRQALLGADNEERCLLTWIESHERNQTSQCSTIADAYGMNEQKLLQFYVDAVVWDMTLPAPQPAGGHLRHHPSM